MRLITVATALICIHNAHSETDGSAPGSHAAWLINYPPHFQEYSKSGALLDVRKYSENMTKFVEMSDYFLARTDGFTDGEVVDAIEHFFWGKMNGIAIELGALDGSPNTRSMTYEYEKTLNWRRILIEGNPSYRTALKDKSPLSFSVNAAICSTATTVHFANSEYIGGIVEFMGQSFMKEYHTKIYDACIPPGNVSSLNFSSIHHLVKPVECIPMSHVLHKAQVKHVNYFILDVEGGEFEVLKSINWAHIKFDVLCIETEEVNRPPGYGAAITAYLAERGYVNATAQQGRNTWYIDKDFVPSARPGLDPQCYNGARKAYREDQWFSNRKTPPFERCRM